MGVVDSVIFHNVLIEKNSYVDRCIIEDNKTNPESHKIC